MVLVRIRSKNSHSLRKSCRTEINLSKAKLEIEYLKRNRSAIYLYNQWGRPNYVWLKLALYLTLWNKTFLWDSQLYISAKCLPKFRPKSQNCASTFVDFEEFSWTWLMNSCVLMISYCWQCLFLYDAFATRNIIAFNTLLSLKMNYQSSFENVAISKSCSWANEPMTLYLFTSSVSLGSTMYTCNRKRFVTMIYKVIFNL